MTLSLLVPSWSIIDKGFHSIVRKAENSNSHNSYTAEVCFRKAIAMDSTRAIGYYLPYKRI